MKNGNDNTPSNIVDFKSAKQKRPTDFKKNRSSAKPRHQTGLKHKAWTYIQFVLFLAVFAYFMRLCQVGGG